ncbi:MAG: hypothetical protein KKC76_17995, partial [Proteobacteria bacterium]|nr:hypothetical protein [Pseudomonadota bacterium]
SAISHQPSAISHQPSILLLTLPLSKLFLPQPQPPWGNHAKWLNFLDVLAIIFPSEIFHQGPFPS